MRKAQATLIVARRIQGATIKSIADEFHMNEVTVKDRLAYAIKENLVQTAQDRVLNELVPLALDAFKKLLEDGDYDAARDVLQGLNIVPKPGTQTITVSQEMTLDNWRSERAQLDRIDVDEIGSGEAIDAGDARGDSPLSSPTPEPAVDQATNQGRQEPPSPPPASKGI